MHSWNSQLTNQQKLMKYLWKHCLLQKNNLYLFWLTMPRILFQFALDLAVFYVFADFLLMFFLWSLYSFLCLFIFVYVKFKVDIWYLLQESWFLWISCRDLSSKPPLGMAQMTHLYISCGVAWTIIGRVSSIMRPTCKVKVTFWSKDCWKLD